RRLSELLAKSGGPYEHRYLAEAFQLVAKRLEPGAAAEAAKTLTDAMAEATNPGILRGQVVGLAAVAARMDPDAAATVPRLATKRLTDLMVETANQDATAAKPITRSGQQSIVSDLAAILPILAARLEPDAADAAYGTVVETLSDIPLLT